MADFAITGIPADKSGQTQTTTNVGTTGTVSQGKRMLGENGATAAGQGAWFRQNGLWKTFMLYPQDRLQATGVGAAVVEIHGCMELPDANPEDAAYELLGTLNAGTLSLSTENPWRYVRAEVTTPAAFAVQVGLHIQGQG